jgi:hypothetical protein
MRRYWSDEEIKALTTLYPHYLAGKVSGDELMAVLPNRTMAGIQQKATILKLTMKPSASIDLKRMDAIKRRLESDMDEYAQSVRGDIKCL